MPHQISKLANGIKVVYVPCPGPVCHCGLVINAGTRDELPGQHGLAHFVEHTVFKGTSHRSAWQILNRLDEVGGELNAYTTKEETAIHASFLKEHFDRAVELIADMVFNSRFPEKEVNKEKEVIIDEIGSYKDNPSELIFDDFEDCAFAGGPLGHNILGTPESVSSFTGADALTFSRANHLTSQMALAVCGDVGWDKALRTAERWLGSHQERCGTAHRTRQETFAHFSETISKETAQGHVLLGSKAPDCRSEDRLAMSVISNMLGGPCMNSRLSVALRERNGIAYNVETNYTSFDDTGLFTIYFGTDSNNISRSMKIVWRELDRLCQSPLKPATFARLMRQYTGQLMMSADDGEGLMLGAGRAAIVYDEAATLEEMKAYILDCVTPEDILRVARQTLAPEAISTLTYK